jgi:hypothetical protein
MYACQGKSGPGSRAASALSPALIHLSTWKRNSRKFAVASYSFTRLQPLVKRPCCSPPAPKHSELVAVVAPFCIKGLRLVTMQLPEKFSPIGVGTNRSSHIRLSRNFALCPNRKVATWPTKDSHLADALTAYPAIHCFSMDRYERRRK